MKHEKTMTPKKTIIVIAIFIVVGIMLVVTVKQGVQVKQDNTGIKISGGLFYSVDVRFSEINDVQLVDSIDYGSRTDGAAIGNYHLGNYRNSAYGSYKLFVNDRIPRYIVIQYDHGETVVFNCKNEEDTKEMYESLVEKIK
ncbi:MAG: PH domain-containing protein [Clostridiales bacterium]|nr:PH domain-containing protein [Clostridiales bacterium]